MKQKKRKRYWQLLLLLVGTSAFSQVLHHQMFTAQGSSTHTKSGLVVNQSIGQFSIAGTYSKSGLIVQQGFQQYGIFKLSVVVPFDDGITTTLYPNPFVENVKLEFSSEVKGFVDIQLADMSGKILLSDTKSVVNNVLTIESLGYLPRGSYVLSLVASNYKYVVMIIKK